MAQFVKTIQNFAFLNDLWEKDSKIIVGVSGGSDSVCLLDVLNKLAPKYGFQLHIAHVNYGLRDKASDLDEVFVRKLAAKYELPLSVLIAKKRQYSGNLESNLRKIRYDYFEELRLEIGFDNVAVAHNQDDQAETVLMRIIRGSGLNGLSAMKAKSVKIIRPLLGTSKGDILAYVKENKLKYRTDKSNADIKFLRNSIRHGLLPYLEKNFNPSIKKTLSEWSIAVACDYAYIDKQAERFVSTKCKIKCVHFSAQDFLKLHSAIQRQAVRVMFRRLLGGVNDIESNQVEELIKVIKSAKKKSPKALVGGLNILKKGDSIDIFC